MITYKLIALLFIVLTPLFSQIMVKLFRLEHYGIKFPDLAFVLFALEIALVSGKFYDNNLLPYYFIVLSLLAIAISLTLVMKSQKFHYPRFFKLFWRIGFLITLFAYLVLVILIFSTKV
ncbi:DUF3397 domain-containing protein [Streptococcus uberis]|uniref:DUF3397 domain-containing protein n=1 Tax=Streptococcus uberis TaxID=1349 RepID=UPI0012B66584|nr:DUF3397 domain-containing protein [Streptococcus uberis]MCK1192156.1 DUF3397 domain-containing protein [Streptococcus uberis]MCK1245539.1 DUF3397 domain-containing protein [Streptococcus uberis]MTB43906.1 DUF3397 family protein [Streptococcus uberis]MTC90356.1 DUF3397 family protein [Streptococcus uberis]MTC95437.1 DUF3397 family protein [Streptococcus uberis]